MVTRIERIPPALEHVVGVFTDTLTPSLIMKDFSVEFEDDRKSLRLQILNIFQIVGSVDALLAMDNIEQDKNRGCIELQAGRP